MGSRTDEDPPTDWEPLREVTLPLSFEIADAPVTQAQWEKLMGNNPSHFQDSGSGAPVENVTWDDAISFCKAASQRSPHWDYTLPTEAQWEYACRAGTTGPWNVEGAVLRQLGWFDENSKGRTHPVRQKQPNAWGLCDCHGNVFEWCADPFEDEFDSTTVADPEGLGEADAGARVLRGGAWAMERRECRSGSRDWHWRYSRGFSIGFRVIRIPKS